MQLCEPYSESLAQYPVAVEPKLDGWRCILYLSPSGRFVARTRSGLNISSRLSHIRKCLCRLARLSLSEPIALDCELQAGSWKETQSVMNCKHRDTERDSALNIHVFDLITKDNTLSYIERKETLERMFKRIRNKSIKLVQYQIANDRDQLHAIYHSYLALGYEGAVIKTLNHTYDPINYNTNWQKLKPRPDVTGSVIEKNDNNILVQLGNRDGATVIPVLINDPINISVGDKVTAYSTDNTFYFLR